MVSRGPVSVSLLLRATDQVDQAGVDHFRNDDHSVAHLGFAQRGVDARAGSRFLAPAAEAGPLEDWHRRRLALGLPDADEIGTDELLWLETNARELNGVSFTKGCYTGQENTARMHHRDKLRKRLLPLRLAAPAAAGTPVMAGEKEAGTLRGAGLGQLHMALLRMDFADQPHSVNGAPAELIRPEWLASQE